MNIICRSEAIAGGLARYFTGKPCKHGHVAERLVSNMGCMQCAAIKFKAYYVKNTDAEKARRQKYKTENRERLNAQRKAERLKNRDQYLEERRQYYANNSERERARCATFRATNPDSVRTASARWGHKNRARRTAMQRERDARKLNATPKWADRDAITKVYVEAARLSKLHGVPYEVDHIFPLQGKTVCGLHVACNLRPVLASVNRRKNNKLPEDVA